MSDTVQQPQQQPDWSTQLLRRLGSNWDAVHQWADTLNTPEDTPRPFGMLAPVTRNASGGLEYKPFNYQKVLLGLLMSGAEDIGGMVKAPGEVLAGRMSVNDAGMAGLKGMLAGAVPEALEGRAMNPDALSAFTLYHGTPHTFDPVEHNPFGEFRDSAIGSGEGAQAYGMGHYLNEDPKVPGTYRTNLSNSNPKILVNGQNYTKNKELPDNVSGFLRLVASKHDTHNGDLDSFVSKVQSQLDNYTSKYANDPDMFSLAKKSVANSQNAIDWFNANRDRIQYVPPNPGNLYTATMDAEKHEFLDLDKPLKDQSPEVLQALRKLYVGPRDDPEKSALVSEKIADFVQDHAPPGTFKNINYDGRDVNPNALAPNYDDFKSDPDDRVTPMLDAIREHGQTHDPDTSGREIYQYLSKNFDSVPDINYNNTNTIRAMDAAGIPGVKYKDAFSRGRDDPEELKALLDQHDRDLNEIKDLDLSTPEGQKDGFSALQKRYPYEAERLQKYGKPVTEDHIERTKDILEAQKELTQEAYQKALANPQTRNFVVFNPKRLNITHRNGKTAAEVFPVEHDPFAGASQ